MARGRVEWHHSAIKQMATEVFYSECLPMAESAQRAANAMKTRPSVADYNLKVTGEGDSWFSPRAIVSADAISTIRNEARTNALLKAGISK